MENIITKKKKILGVLLLEEKKVCSYRFIALYSYISPRPNVSTSRFIFFGIKNVGNVYLSVSEFMTKIALFQKYTHSDLNERRSHGTASRYRQYKRRKIIKAFGYLSQNVNTRRV